MIKVYNDTAKLYKGNYKKATFYKGNTRYTGYKTLKKSGNDFTVEGTFDDKLKPCIYANAVQDDVIYYQCEGKSFKLNAGSILNPEPIRNRIEGGLYPLFLRDGIYTCTLPALYSVGEKADKLIINTNNGTARTKIITADFSFGDNLEFTEWQGDNGSFIEFSLPNISDSSETVLDNFTLGEVAESLEEIENSGKIIALSGKKVRWYPKYTDIGLTASSTKAEAETALNLSLSGIENKSFTYLLEEPVYSNLMIVKRKTYTLNSNPVFTPVTTYGENLLVLPQEYEETYKGITATFSEENRITVSGYNNSIDAFNLFVLKHIALKSGRISVNLLSGNADIALCLDRFENGQKVTYKSHGIPFNIVVNKGEELILRLEISSTATKVNRVTVMPQLYYGTDMPLNSGVNLVAPNSKCGTVGKNKIKFSHLYNTDNWYDTGENSYRYEFFGLKYGVTYTLSFDYSILPDNLCFEISADEGRTWRKTVLTTDVLVKKKHTFVFEKNEICAISMLSRAQSVNFTYFQIEEGQNATQYSEYISYSPSVEFPQRILPSSANKIVSEGKDYSSKTTSDISSIVFYGVETNSNKANRIIVDSKGVKHYCLVDFLEKSEKNGEENYKLTGHFNSHYLKSEEPIYYQESAIRTYRSQSYTGLKIDSDLKSHPIRTKVYFETKPNCACLFAEIETSVAEQVV